jgi:ATP-binding cassette subfamily C (CFTR/MRP) protein 4
LIDEATANIDQKTDDLIQTVITEKFQDQTVLIIAHRLITVAKCDRIFVMDNGIVVNYDTSKNILHSYQ